MKADLAEKLPKHADKTLSEEEFLRVYDRLSVIVVENADSVRPSVWAYVVRGFANAVSLEMEGANPCPGLNEPLTP
jgi:hypothetical protein